MSDVKQHCTCDRAKLEQDVLSRLQADHPNENLTIDDYGLGFQCKSYTGQLYNEFKYQYFFTKKNGQESISKTRTASMFHAFCGFCGKPYKLEE